jgi:hypothetical protein
MRCPEDGSECDGEVAKECWTSLNDLSEMINELEMVVL